MKAVPLFFSVLTPVGAQMVIDYHNIASSSQNVTEYKGLLEKSKEYLFGLNKVDALGYDTETVVHETILKEGVKECDPNVQQHSGYIAFDGNGGAKKSYFFWMFESRSEPSTDPLVLWLTGGPGCSSQMALLTENGPCTVAEDGKTLKPNPNTWNTKANVIWVDQPAGTGFSEGAYDHDEDGVAKDMYAFLVGFMGKFPQYQKVPFYITGESYAGHYIPAISHEIWTQNKKDKKINLKGMAIGNGLTNPEIQYKYYPQMAYDGGKSEGGSLEHGVITNPFTQAIMKGGVGPCTSAIKSCNGGSSAGCLSAFLICNYAETVPYQFTGMNVYDMREKCKVPPLCYDFSAVTTFLNDEGVQQKLGAKGKWASCNMIVNTFFRGDFMRSYHTLIPDMLHDDIQVLIYAGDVDYICNWLGNKAWTLDLDWNGKDGFSVAEDKDYSVAGKAAGRLRNFQNFSFLQIYNAGHMVPLNQPEVALQMLNEFIGAQSKSKTNLRGGAQETIYN